MNFVLARVVQHHPAEGAFGFGDLRDGDGAVDHFRREEVVVHEEDVVALFFPRVHQAAHEAAGAAEIGLADEGEVVRAGEVAGIKGAAVIDHGDAVVHGGKRRVGKQGGDVGGDVVFFFEGGDADVHAFVLRFGIHQPAACMQDDVGAGFDGEGVALGVFFPVGRDRAGFRRRRGRAAGGRFRRSTGFCGTR